jgi:F-type H+-transporting ATPase subunit a
VTARTKWVLAGVVVAGIMAASAFVPAFRAESARGVPAEEHWSVLTQFFPGLLHNLQGMIAGHKTYLEGQTPERVSHVIMALLAAGIVVLLSLAVFRKARGEQKLVPDRRLTPFLVMEMVVEAAFSLMAGVMGEKNARRYFPLVGTSAVFILTSNLLGMVPGLVPPTDTLNTTFAMGIVVFFSTHFFGFREHGISYAKHFFGPIIKWYALPFMLFMFVVEGISHLVRPCSLGVRLMGNIMGDHKVLGLFLGFGVLFVPLPMMALGLLVAVVQTLVFCLLSTVYIGLAVEHGEGH